MANPRIPALEACQIAAEILKGAGFELRQASLKTEACYYALPGFDCLLRVAAHPNKKPPVGLGAVVAKVTFHPNGCADAPGMVSMSDEKLEATVATAIGYYLIRAASPPMSRYYGKKGTWEHADQRDGSDHRRRQGASREAGPAPAAPIEPDEARPQEAP